MKNREEDKISIILPTYNSNKTLEKAIKSVENQTYKNWELLVIENGIKGQVEQICKSFKNVNIKYLYEQIPNVSNARNIGIQNATGNYITFIDSDDEYEKDFLEEMIKNIKTNDSQLVTCGYRNSIAQNDILINYKETLSTNDIKKYIEILKENYLYNEIWNKLYITEIIKKYNVKFDTKYELGEDFLFNLDYTKHIDIASFINKPLYRYTDDQNGLNLKYRKNKFEIEYSLTQYLEKIYQEKKWNLDYVYNRYARVYYNQIIDLYNKNNPLSTENKNKMLKEIISAPEYKENLESLQKKVTDTKFKIAIKYFFLKGEKRIKLFIKLNNIRKR